MITDIIIDGNTKIIEGVISYETCYNDVEIEYFYTAKIQDGKLVDTDITEGNPPGGGCRDEIIDDLEGHLSR